MYSKFMITIPMILLVIYFLLLLITHSYLLPLIVLLVAPFSTAGGILGLSFLGMQIDNPIGLVAVIGIAVNNAIVLLYEIDNRLKDSFPLIEVLLVSSKRRFKAIFLTASTTGIALMPIIFDKSIIGQFSKGMSVQILFGLIAATIVTLLLLPCFYLILNDIRRLFYALWFWRIPKREELEASGN